MPDAPPTQQPKESTKGDILVQLLAAFQALDEERSSHMDRDQIQRVLIRLGFPEADATRLLEGSGCCSSTEGVNYERFLQWLVGSAGASGEVLDAGVEPAPRPLASANAGFGAWPERCAQLLEARGEAEFVQQRLIAAQVRAQCRRLAETQLEAQELSLCRTHSLGRSQALGLGAALQDVQLEWDGPALLHRFLCESVSGIPQSYVERLLAGMTEELPRRHPKPLVRLRVPSGPGGRLVVVGDTHGQLQDVLLIMLLHGRPSTTNVYLFNGDVADRGPHACEIFLLIFAFYLCEPGSVVLVRGNHEDEHMNMMSADYGGGFYEECLHKYGESTYWSFVEVFKLLPLAAAVNDEVFVVHGGLPGGPPPGLGDVSAVPHTEACCPDPDAEAPEERLLLDLLWSDPMESAGFEPNPRGSGTLWGPDVTKAFLAKNNLRWMIRSHELPWDGERGWMEHHLGLVFTVFSASNYCGYEVNWGAVALLTVGADGRLEQALREHNISGLEVLPEVANLPEGKAREERCLEIGLSWVDGDRVAVGERRVRLALRRLAGIVLEHKPELWRSFRASDLANTGTVNRMSWVKSLMTICGEDLPWEEASKCWIPGPLGQAVDYRRFLGRFRVVLAQERWCGWKSLVISEVYEELLSRHATAEEMLRTFDPSGDGVVSVSDFMAMIQECAGGCLTEPQVAALTRTVFAHSYGRGLRVGCFLSRFTLAFVQSKGMVPADQTCFARLGPTLDQIGKLIVRARGEGCRAPPGMPAPLERFATQPACIKQDRGPALGSTATAGLDHGHHSRGLSPPPPALELERASSAVPAMPAPLGREPSSALLHAFELFNDSGHGLLQVDEFVRHVAELPGIGEVRHEGRTLDEAGIREIASAIASSCCGSGGDGSTINLLQFASAFAVVDASGNTDLADDLHEHILTFLWRHQNVLRSSCAERDVDGCGRVSRQDFARVLEALNFCTAKPTRNLTRTQMSLLVESLAEEDGSVEYEAFLSSFEVQVD